MSSDRAASFTAGTVVTSHVPGYNPDFPTNLVMLAISLPLTRRECLVTVAADIPEGSLRAPLGFRAALFIPYVCALSSADWRWRASVGIDVFRDRRNMAATRRGGQARHSGDFGILLHPLVHFAAHNGPFRGAV